MINNKSMYKIIYTLSLLFCFSISQAQLKVIEKGNNPVQNVNPVKDIRKKFGHSQPSKTGTYQLKEPIGKLDHFRVTRDIQVYGYDENNMPSLIKGNLEEFDTNIERQGMQYLAAITDLYKIKDPASEWKLIQNTEDEIGMQHLKYDQYYNGVPIYNGQLILHAKKGRIQTAMGKGFPTPQISTDPTLDLATAEREAVDHLKKTGKYTAINKKYKQMLGMKQVEAQLVIYHLDGKIGQERLAYFIKIYENMASQKTMILDAHTGEVIHKHDMICKIHGVAHNHSSDLALALPPDGPTTASGTDLNNATRTINTYQVGNDYILLDASRPMYSESQSEIPNEPVGAIWTLDAFDTSPQNNETFELGQNVSSNNTWSKKQVSAHYNAGVTYEYFKDVHGRNSINGSGGNIVSIINVTDENDNAMDNAFWNGVAMWYGNGNVAFNALPGGLDVAGHEMTHGVIQATANLRYENESGALNESFADVFGAMMDREDYKIGEDVVKTSAFPSGALRDLANPNNGGNSLSDPGYQPAHVNQQYTGSADNGGVHINSGIPNKAFHLFAEAIGKEKAEKVYYRALTQYLTVSSVFVDARNAVVMSAQDLYGATESNAAKSAFDAVGIGAGSSGNYQNDSGENPGAEHLLYADNDLSNLFVTDAQINPVFDPLTTTDIISKPSISDDGSIIYFVNGSNQIEAVFINWDNNTTNQIIVQDQQIWSNVVVSKDGNRIAAVQKEQVDRIYVYDFTLGSNGQWYTGPDGLQGFKLFNPTYTEGISTGDAKYADAMEFDLTGAVLIYDAYSEVGGSQGQTIGYWDIGFLNVWDNKNNTWANGKISKLFSQLAEGISVGNPTFSKNSPYIVAFDYIEGEEYAIVGANIETGKVSIIFENSSLGYPSYTGTDGQLVFTSTSPFFGSDVFFLNLNEDKISTVANSEGILKSEARLGIAFRNGTRPLTNVDDQIISEDKLQIYPNPVENMLYLDMEMESAVKAKISILGIDGKVIASFDKQFAAGETTTAIRTSQLHAGQYILQIQSGLGHKSVLFSKQ